MGLFAPIIDYVDTLVHPSAQQDVLTAARHRAFITPRLVGSIVALATFPVYLIARGNPSALELLVFAWLSAPILIVYFLSRSGHYEYAHLLSSLALTALVAAVTAATGGIASFAAIWLVVVPFEASLSASRRVVAAASMLTLAAAGLLLLLGFAGAVPAPAAPAPAALAALAVISAVLYGVGVALNVASLTRMSFTLRNAEEDRYRLLARNMTDVIARHGRDGAVLFVSPAAEVLFGVPPTTLHQHGLFERVHVADRPAYLSALGDAAVLREARSVEFRVRCDSGDGSDDCGPGASRFVWIEMRCRPLEQAGSGHKEACAAEVVAVMRDVSSRKLHEQALERARSEAERANARKSRFLATMSHELRTPLNAIIGFSEMLRNEAALVLDAGRRAEYATLINDSGRHLLAVVNGILDMSKLETDNFAITPEPFSPARVIESCCEMVALPARDAGIQVERAVAADLPEMIADKRALQQILLNLLSNAVRFSKRGGKVVMAARAEAGAVVLTVEDDGVGISDEDLDRIGEPYFQASASYDRRHGGTGLGLSIVKGLVRLHGGELSIQSRLGEGTRVTVRLPLDCEVNRAPRRAAAAEDLLVLPPRPGSAGNGGSSSAAGPEAAASLFPARLEAAVQVKKSA